MSSSAKPTLTRAEELNAKGALFFREGQMEPARLHWLAALSLEPNQAQVLQNLSAVLRNMNHYEAAESVAKRSVIASKDNPYCRSNLGVAQLGLKKFNEALTTLRSVTRDLPDSGPSWHNYALVLYMIGRFGEALVAFDKAVTLGYATEQVLSDRSLCLLALGRIQEGLESYEVRWLLIKKNKIWDLGIQEWQGEPLKGMHLLVHHEQGFGDSIMLVRFVKQLAEQGAIITLAVPEELRLIFTYSFPFIKVLGSIDDVLPDVAGFDYHTPLLSVMRWLGIAKLNDISPEPYLSVPNRPLAFALPKAKANIGICWASGNHGKALLERRRLVPVTAFLTLSEIPGISLVSLQKGKEAGDIVANGMEGLIFDLQHRLDSFAETAEIINKLDLVISVDSAVAHLAGALGKPCLMLSPYSRCWRWWTNNNGLPWYNNMAVFSQEPGGSWNEPMRKVVAWIDGRRKQNRDMG